MKRRAWLPVGIALLALAGCGPDRADPAAVLRAYLEALSRDDLETAYALLSDDDRAFRTLDGYVALESIGDAVLVRELAHRTRFEVLSVDDEGERALVRVRVTRPDAAQAFGVALQQGFSGGASWDDAAASALEGPLPELESVETFVLVRASDGWCVRLGRRLDVRQLFSAVHGEGHDVAIGIPHDDLGGAVERLPLG
jgi:hypothetical protein